MISEKKCEVLRDNSIHPTAIIITSSFEDKKWKRKISDELGSNIRTWARSKKHVLIIFNKKDDAELKKSLFYKLSKSAKQHIYVGTVGMLTYPPRAQFDYVVWLFPEWTLRSIDYRSSERAKIIVSRLALLVASHDVYIGTRYGDVAKEVFGIKDEEWINKIFAERKRFNLPPYTQLVRLTMRDKTNAKAYARAEAIRTLIEESSGSHIAYGPYQELGAKKKLVHEYHVLLAGELQKLVEIYKELPIDAADVAPYRIV
ncbi:MAG TPA: hypothetical protein VLG69_02170 [Candidatus Andersenbacteria bacterium]|nr:hypothetical protein [Candidatus Andersenbacteria bacterium]